ncbi:MAG: winged helix-turn-helix transcriptional regulator [Candidatus Doudnabacteria bacterium]|nr:winged helix-turn-helix transcriptional regulator [Candidatus Doudnabacteria bacterium]
MGTISEIELTKDLARRARLLELAGNPTRIRILCVLYERGEVCVSDIAKSLNMSIASISHHLQIMKDNGLVEDERMGNSICYKPVKNELTNKLKKFICE